MPALYFWLNASPCGWALRHQSSEEVDSTSDGAETSSVTTELLTFETKLVKPLVGAGIGAGLLTEMVGGSDCAGTVIGATAIDLAGCVTVEGHLLAVDFVAKSGETLRSNLPPVCGLEANSSFCLNESNCGEKAALRRFCPTSRSGSKMAVVVTGAIVEGGLPSKRLGVNSLEPTDFDSRETVCGAIVVLAWLKPTLRSFFDFLPDFFAGMALRLFVVSAGVFDSISDAFIASFSLIFARGTVLFVNFSAGRFNGRRTYQTKPTNAKASGISHHKLDKSVVLLVGSLDIGVEFRPVWANIMLISREFWDLRRSTL